MTDENPKSTKKCSDLEDFLLGNIDEKHLGKNFL